MWCFALASGIPALLGRMPGWRRLRAPSGYGGGRVDWVAGSAMVVRRSVWQECGPFDLGYRFYCQDLDLCFATHRAGRRVAVVKGFRVLHHHGATIAARPGASGSFHPGHLWADLVRFTGKYHGPEAARRAAVTLAAGARLRLLGRALASPFATDRETWTNESDAFREGMKTLKV